MKEYLVVPLTTGFFSHSLDETKLQKFLNKHAQQGWRFVRSIHETKRVYGGLFSREAHFVIFERDTMDDATPHLLRQLLRAYNIEPEA
jgi:hypothetical protein